MTATPDSPAIHRPPGGVRGFAIRRPVLAFCLFAVGLSVALITALLVADVSIIPGKAAQLLILPGTAVLITAWLSGRAGVRRLFAGLLQWRIGITRWLLVLLALPVLTVAVAAVTGTLENPPTGWIGIATTYLLTLVLVLITANLWEEMAWTGFVQTRLMARHGLLRGALLTAIPVFVIHMPLSYETNGLYGTRWEDAALNWALLLVALPTFRYLAGVLMLDTQGSVLAVGVLHASFNASGGMDVTPGGWQYIPAVVLLALLVAIHRRIRGDRRSQPVTATPAAEAGAAATDQPASQHRS
jgi:membrane protease YdiL (CAAX protease family)